MTHGAAINTLHFLLDAKPNDPGCDLAFKIVALLDRHKDTLTPSERETLVEAASVSYHASKAAKVAIDRVTIS